MIAIEWSQFAFRAFRLTPAGAIRDRRSSARGLARIQDRRFGDALREEVGPWLAAGEQHVLLCGAIAGPDGWTDVPAIACPAGAAEIAAALVPIGFDWAEVRALPHLACAAPDGTPDVSRGEEGAFAAALAMLPDGGLACLPGLRSRWVRIAQHRIAGFSTHLTGEAFAALRPPVPATRMAREPAITDVAAFEAGLARAGQAGGVLHHLAAARSLVAAGALNDDAAAAYLFGVLTGHEAREGLAANPGLRPVHVIGAPDLTAAYGRAIEAAGGMAERLDGEAVARGLALIGAAAGVG